MDVNGWREPMVVSGTRLLTALRATMAPITARPRHVVLAALILCLTGIAPAAGQAQNTTDASSDARTYTVQDGDTLYRISRQFGVEVEMLQRWNDLTGTQITPGQTLRVRPPTSAGPASDPASPEPAGAETESPADAPTRDTSAPTADSSAPPDPSGPTAGDSTRTDREAGDSLRADRDTVSTGPESTRSAPDSARADTAATRVEATSPAPYGRTIAGPGASFLSLALRTGTTADSLYALNDSLTAPLPATTTVRLPRRFGPPTHVVQPGQTLYQIAGRYGVSVRALRAANDLSDATLSPGQRLRIPGRMGVQPTAPGTLASSDTTGRVAVYPPPFAGRLTASGTAYDPDEFVGSHPSLPYGSLVLLTNPETTRSTFVRIVDRGPVEENLLMDVSAAVAETLGLDDRNSTVEFRVVWVER
jgi:LysM repeat protein